MNNDRVGKQNTSQSAIDGVNVGGNFSVNSIHQNISQVDQRLLYLEILNKEYRASLIDLKNKHTLSILSNLEFLRQDLVVLQKSLKLIIDDTSVNLINNEKKHELYKTIIKQYRSKQYKLREPEPDKEIYIKDLLSIEERHKYRSEDCYLILMDVAVRSIHDLNETLCIEHTIDEIKENRETIILLEEDIDEIENLIDSVSQLLKLKLTDIDIDLVFKNSLSTSEAKEGIEEIKESFDINLSLLEEEFNLDKEKIEKHRDINIYKFELVRHLKQDGFPLSDSSVNLLENFFDESALDEWDIKKIGELELMSKDSYKDNLEQYRQTYLQKLELNGLCLNEENTDELNSSKKSLGLKSLIFIRSDVSRLEREISKQFCFSKLLLFSREFDRSEYLKEGLIALGIQEEVLSTVEGIVKKGWRISHLISPTSKVDYWSLINSFAEKDWEKADKLTANSIVKFADIESSESLSEEALRGMPEEDIYTIDKLWTEYSRGHFGFSIQKKIFESVESKPKWLFEELGWKKKGFGIKPLKRLSELDFTLDAPRGHLPAWNVENRKIFRLSCSLFEVWNLDNLDPDTENSSDFEDMRKHYSEKGFWKKINKFGRKAGKEVIEKVLTLYYAAQQPNVPVASKVLMLGAIGYFILPFDFVSDFIPVVGWTDDLSALGAAVTSAASYITPEVTKKVKDKIGEIFGND